MVISQNAKFFNIAITILDFSQLLPIKLSLIHLRDSKVIAFCIGFVDCFLTSFLYCFPYCYRSSIILKTRLVYSKMWAIEKEKQLSLSQYSWKSDKYRMESKGKKQRNYTTYEAKKIQSDNFTRSDRENE